MRSLSLDELAPLFEGALGLRRDDQAIQPIRLPLADIDLHHASLRSPFTAEATAGVRIRLASDTTRLELDVEQVQPPGFPASGVYDLLVGDALTRVTADPADDGSAVVAYDGLPAGDKVLEVWLPTGMAVRVRAVGVDDGATAGPAPDDSPRWVTYGSSITHCAWVPGPTETWPSIAARALGWHLTSMGFNGSCHMDPFVARAIAALPADRITLKLGINVHNHQSLRERTFGPAAHGFVQTIRDRHPTTPLTVISPILSPEREDSPVSTIPLMRGAADPFVGDLSVQQMREILQDVVERRQARGDEAIEYLDGRELLGPADVQHLPDGLHPDPTGYALMGRRFVELFS